jgi:hypothetical protein
MTQFISSGGKRQCPTAGFEIHINVALKKLAAAAGGHRCRQ